MNTINPDQGDAGMVNALVHDITVEDAHTVETSLQLEAALQVMADNADIDLADSYRVELLAEKLSDGSVAYSIRIRVAEAI